MSLKAELETWGSALKAYDEEDFEKALDLFSRIADSSKILTNMGLIYATLGEHEAAVEQFNAATQLDQYLAVAYFQCGVSNFLLGRYDMSLRDFEEALLYLRGNQAINYEQLGLKFKLFSAEVLFNKGLSRIYMGDVDTGLMDMQAARMEKATNEHNVIDDAIADRGEGYTVFSIPVGVLYRPSENKLKNTKTKDYMGKAKLIATENPEEAYTEFTGVARKERGFIGGGEIPDVVAGDGGGLGRSQTVPPPRVTVDDTRPSGLMRSRTVLPVADRTRQGGAAMNAGMGAGRAGIGAGGAGAGGAGLQRSMTSIRPGMASSSPVSLQQNGLTRGLSVRKSPNTMGMNQNKMSPTASLAPPPPPEKNDGPGQGPARLTEIYDDYMGPYAGDGAAPPPVPVASAPSTQRVAQWARNNANPAMTPSRAPSTRAPSGYGSFSSAGSLRRKPTRRVNGGSGASISMRGRAMSPYEEEEEGYVSGEYDDGMTQAGYEMTKIRVKLHYQDDVRGMTLSVFPSSAPSSAMSVVNSDAGDMSWETFRGRVARKFGRKEEELGMKFVDEDGGRVTLQDESDWEMAVETAREVAASSGKGRPEGKLEVWVVDL